MRQQMFGRGRVAALAAVAASSLLVLAACSSDDNSSNAGAGADSKGPITFAMGSNDIKTVTPLIDEWNKDHPDQKVTVKELAADADSARVQLVNSLGAGNTDYDVMALDVVWTAEFAAKGWIAPLEGDLAVDTSKLLKAPVASATYNGKLYAVPQNTNAQLLYYNTDVVKSAPKTWADISTACEDKGTKACYITQLKQYEGLTVNVSEFINGWGGSVVGDDGKTPTLDTPAAKAGLTALVEAYKSGVISKASNSYTEEETANNFLAGRAAFAQNWPYMIAAADDSAVAGKFKVTTMVAENGVGTSTLGGYNDAINAKTKNKGTAKAFLEYIAGEKVQTAFMKNSFSPVLASIYDDPAIVKEFPWATTLKAALEAAKPRPVSPFYSAISKAIQDNAYAALTGTKSVDQALADMTAAIQTAGQ